MKILVINAGSSSLKYQLIDMKTEKVVGKGVIERIGQPNSFLTQKNAEGVATTVEVPLPDHNAAMALTLEMLTHAKHGVIKSVEEISAVGHRVVHSAEDFSVSVVINEKVLEICRHNSELAPLHNPANIMGITACLKAMPKTPMVAVFDTAFHATMPQKAFMYALPVEMYKNHRVRRYGFHGTSHYFVSQEAAKHLGKDIKKLKIVTCHLGNGSSVAAVDGGKSVDTSMGFTPLEGLPMGTRSGSIDVALVEYLMKKENKSVTEITEILNKKSGFLGISGVSSDFRDLRAAAESGNERAALAIEIFAYSVKKYIGAYAAAMGGLDCVVFTAGLGENAALVREKAASGLEFLGIKFDAERNQNLNRDGITEISAAKSPVKVLVVPTNEELVIARETQKLVNK